MRDKQDTRRDNGFHFVSERNSVLQHSPIPEQQGANADSRANGSEGLGHDHVSPGDFDFRMGEHGLLHASHTVATAEMVFETIGTEEGLPSPRPDAPVASSILTSRGAAHPPTEQAQQNEDGDNNALDQAHGHRVADAPAEPPNYRHGSDTEHCSNCKMFDDGKCWGYGNKQVEADAVCDSWSKSTTAKTATDDVYPLDIKEYPIPPPGSMRDDYGQLEPPVDSDCPYCRGKGSDRGNRPCQWCGGTGIDPKMARTAAVPDWKEYFSPEEQRGRQQLQLPLPQTMYHVAPTWDRHRIRTWGLQPSKPDAKEWGRGVHENQPEGVYLHAEPSSQFSRSQPHDTWKVQVDPSKLQPDAYVPGAFSHSGPIEPESLTLFRPHEDQFPTRLPQVGERYMASAPYTNRTNNGPVEVVKEPYTDNGVVWVPVRDDDGHEWHAMTNELYPVPAGYHTQYFEQIRPQLSPYKPSEQWTSRHDHVVPGDLDDRRREAIGTEANVAANPAATGEALVVLGGHSGNHHEGPSDLNDWAFSPDVSAVSAQEHEGSRRPIGPRNGLTRTDHVETVAASVGEVIGQPRRHAQEDSTANIMYHVAPASLRDKFDAEGIEARPMSGEIYMGPRVWLTTQQNAQRRKEAIEKIRGTPHDIYEVNIEGHPLRDDLNFGEEKVTSESVPPDRIRRVAASHVMYHVSPSGNRERIRTEGLDPNAERLNDQAGHEPGVYVWDTPETAMKYRGQGPNMWRDMDIHAVDVAGLAMQPDQWLFQHRPDRADDFPGGYFVNQHIEPSRIYPHFMDPWHPDEEDIDPSALGTEQEPWEFEQANRHPKAAANPPTYYHVAPADRHESIMQHGLQGTEHKSPWGYDTDQWYQRGNYLYSDPDYADEYAGQLAWQNQQPMHIYEVNGDNLDVQDDPENQDAYEAERDDNDWGEEYDPSYDEWMENTVGPYPYRHFTPSPIAPQQLKHIDTVQPDEQWAPHQASGPLYPPVDDDAQATPMKTSAMSPQPYTQGGDYAGYLNWFRQNTLEDLLQHQRELPESGMGYPTSNYATALAKAIREKEGENSVPSRPTLAHSLSPSPQTPQPSRAYYTNPHRNQHRTNTMTTLLALLDTPDAHSTAHMHNAMHTDTWAWHSDTHGTSLHSGVEHDTMVRANGTVENPEVLNNEAHLELGWLGAFQTARPKTVTASPANEYQPWTGTKVPFRELPPEHQKAIAHYMAIDGEAWPYPPDLGTDLEGAMPHYIEKYGEMPFEYGEVPTQELADHIMKHNPTVSEHPDWKTYEDWYHGLGDMPDHPTENRWPVILDTHYDDVLQDGWHRFHDYAKKGAETIPWVRYGNRGPTLEREAGGMVWQYRVPFYAIPSGAYSMGQPGQEHKDIRESPPEFKEHYEQGGVPEDGYMGEDQGHVIFHPTYGEMAQWPTAFELSPEHKEGILQEARKRFKDNPVHVGGARLGAAEFSAWLAGIGVPELDIHPVGPGEPYYNYEGQKRYWNFDPPPPANEVKPGEDSEMCYDAHDHNGNLIGSIIASVDWGSYLEQKDPQLYIASLYVLPEYRKEGVAESLAKTLMDDYKLPINPGMMSQEGWGVYNKGLQGAGLDPVEREPGGSKYKDLPEMAPQTITPQMMGFAKVASAYPRLYHGSPKPLTGDMRSIWLTTDPKEARDYAGIGTDTGDGHVYEFAHNFEHPFDPDSDDRLKETGLNPTAQRMLWQDLQGEGYDHVVRFNPADNRDPSAPSPDHHTVVALDPSKLQQTNHWVVPNSDWDWEPHPHVGSLMQRRGMAWDFKTCPGCEEPLGEDKNWCENCDIGPGQSHEHEGPLYHYSPVENRKAIMEQGLLPNDPTWQDDQPEGVYLWDDPRMGYEWMGGDVGRGLDKYEVRPPGPVHHDPGLGGALVYPGAIPPSHFMIHHNPEDDRFSSTNWWDEPDVVDETVHMKPEELGRFGMKPAPPQNTLWHFSPPENRGDIIQNGLEPRRRKGILNPPGVYMWNDPQQGNEYWGQPTDVYEVNTKDLPLYHDDWYQDEGMAFRSEHPIPPERVRQIGWANQRKAMAADPQWWNDHWSEQEDPYLYHVTEARDWEPWEIQQRIHQIKQEGLRWQDDPQQRRWNDGLTSRPNHIYFSTPGNVHGPGIVWKVDPRKLDPKNINPDEDWFLFGEYANRDDWSRGQEAEKRDLGSDPAHAVESLSRDTIAHNGPIPPELVEHAGFVNENGQITPDLSSDQEHPWVDWRSTPGMVDRTERAAKAELPGFFPTFPHAPEGVDVENVTTQPLVDQGHGASWPVVYDYDKKKMYVGDYGSYHWDLVNSHPDLKDRYNFDEAQGLAPGGQAPTEQQHARIYPAGLGGGSVDDWFERKFPGWQRWGERPVISSTLDYNVIESNPGSGSHSGVEPQQQRPFIVNGPDIYVGGLGDAHDEIEGGDRLDGQAGAFNIKNGEFWWPSWDKKEPGFSDFSAPVEQRLKEHFQLPERKQRPVISAWEDFDVGPQGIQVEKATDSEDDGNNGIGIHAFNYEPETNTVRYGPSHMAIAKAVMGPGNEFWDYYSDTPSGWINEAPGVPGNPNYPDHVKWFRGHNLSDDQLRDVEQGIRSHFGFRPMEPTRERPTIA